MKNIVRMFLFMFLCLSSAQEEKRLALVIGNANYDKGELKNPVNDARLIASTLDSLDFDVILKENLSSRSEMLSAIAEFGKKRSEYDVAFVYYAGHGIQLDDENFLLPTKEVFEEEFNVLDNGVSVQKIMRYLEAQTDEVNVLILDACRDNPFESSFNTTRSLKGKGLAKIPPPTGSLIAFSTDSGQTAPDGDGDNSAYTISLAKNMLLEDTSIDQVFRNVRAEILAETNGAQRPVEYTQLTGKAFYLNVPDKWDLAARLEAEGKNEEAIAVYQKYLKENPLLDSFKASVPLSAIALNYLSLGLFDTSASYAKKAVDAEVYDYTAAWVYSLALYFQKRYDAAKRAIDLSLDVAKAMKADESSLYNIYKHQGDVFSALGAFNESVASYELAYGYGLKGDEISYDLALSLIKTGKFQKALSLLEERELFLMRLGALERDQPKNNYYLKFSDDAFKTTVKDVLSNISVGYFGVKKASVALSDVYSARSRIYGNPDFEDFELFMAMHYMNMSLVLDKSFKKHLLRADNALTLFAGIKDKEIGKMALESYDAAKNFLTDGLTEKTATKSEDEYSEMLRNVWAGYIQVFLISENYKLALESIDESIYYAPSADAYYKKAFVFGQQEKYYESYAQITLAIESFMTNPSQKITRAVGLNEIGFAELVEFKSYFFELYDFALCEEFFERELAFVTEKNLKEDEVKIRKIIDENCQ